MHPLKIQLGAVTSTLCLTAFSTSLFAQVFVCTNSNTDPNCNNYAAITATQQALKPRTPDEPTVDQALKDAGHDSVRNGYNSVGNTNLYLKSDLWHLGGDNQMSAEHLTAYVYKNDQKVRTCHVFSTYLPTQKVYRTTCDK